VHIRIDASHGESVSLKVKLNLLPVPGFSPLRFPPEHIEYRKYSGISNDTTTLFTLPTILRWFLARLFGNRRIRCWVQLYNNAAFGNTNGNDCLANILVSRNTWNLRDAPKRQIFCHSFPSKLKAKFLCHPLPWKADSLMNGGRLKNANN